jgi:Protein of unknown function (DUF1353)
VDPTQLARTPVRIAASSLPPPIVSYREGTWLLEAAYGYDDGGTRLTVPAGFRFDLASVPRLFWPLVAPFELSIAAPLLHDFLYRHAGAPPPPAVLPPRRYARRDADRLFRDVMAAEGVAAWRRHAAWAAARVLGAPSWGRPGPA